jgi:hypothetical protein
MGPLVSLDASLVVLGLVGGAVGAGLRLRRRRPTRRPAHGAVGTTVMLFLSLGAFAVAAVDVGLSEWDKTRWAFEPPLRVGTLAPDFSLPRLEDGEPVRLSDFRDRKPVCLILSSFT